MSDLDLVTTYSFSNTGSLTYNSTFVETVGTQTRLKSSVIDDRPANAYFAHLFDTKDANWSSGSLTGTLNGSPLPTIANNAISFSGVAGQSLDLALNSTLQTGTVRVSVTPHYAGIPTQYLIPFMLYKDTSTTIDQISVYHVPTTGIINVYMGGVVTPLGVWSQVLDRTYEWELNYNLTTGISRFFIDGTQFGPVITTVSTRDASTNLRIGGWVDPNIYPGTFSLSNLIIFSTVQHTANYIPGPVSIPSAPNHMGYSTTSPTVQHSSAFNSDLIEDVDIVASDNVRYSIKADNLYWYFDGTAWVSEATPIHSNSKEAFENNYSSFLPPGKIGISIVAFLTSDGLTPSFIESIKVTYSFFSKPLTVTKTIVYFYCYDTFGDPIKGVTITFNPIIDAVVQNTLFKAIHQKQITTNDMGYAELVLPAHTYNVTIFGMTYSVVVPDVQSVALSSLLSL